MSASIKRLGQALVFVAFFSLIGAAMPWAAYADDLLDGEVKRLREVMEMRGMGEPTSAELLLDRRGNPSFVIGRTSEGYLIAEREKGVFMEQGGEPGPYSDAAIKKYYGGPLCYAEDRGEGLVNARTGLPIAKVPWCPASEGIVGSPGHSQRNDPDDGVEIPMRDQVITVLLPGYHPMMQGVAFGLNSSSEGGINNTCSAVALSIAMNYLDYAVDGRIVDSDMELERRRSAGYFASAYPQATEFHRYLVEDCGLAPHYFNSLTLGVWGPQLVDGLGEYIDADDDRFSSGLELGWTLGSALSIRESIDRNMPPLITVEFDWWNNHLYDFHTMAAYGYRILPDGTMDVNLHSGWYENDESETEPGDCYYAGDIWTSIEIASLTHFFSVSDGLHHSGSGEYKYYEDDEPVTAAWRTVGGYDYYFGDDGLRATGWKTIGGNTYRFDSNGVRATGYYVENGIRYCFDVNGVLVSQTPISPPFTGPSDDAQLTALQASYQERLQSTGPDGIPAALGRAMSLNPDVFGWLYVPGTEVSMPLTWREGDGSFYLDHDSLGNESAIGCAYTTGGAGMSDPVTAVYGHSFAAGGLALTSLHAFEDAAFFAGHEEAYVYLPGRRLEYRVVGANLFNARAIEDVDQSDPADMGDYFAELCNPDPDTFLGYKRRGSLDPASDRVLQLSTCTVPADPARRFVVTCAYEGEEAV